MAKETNEVQMTLEESKRILEGERKDNEEIANLRSDFTEMKAQLEQFKTINSSLKSENDTLLDANKRMFLNQGFSVPDKADEDKELSSDEIFEILYGIK